ncbi:hypothetical protein FBF86_05685 [Serratia marcescens]|uniref:hypothetical protein n=1 Tax=Serratia marcescens TaxID=615 RepID=UPI00114FD8D5|nr:hypothetical protein [Serratia marcescens]QDI17498.1 hypothetical protein FBF86_05685 [Serratia marcescens]QDI27241.1 hypothetical protein FG169_05685 [Serratia marcescens]
MNELKNNHSYMSQIFSRPDAELMPTKLGKTVFDHPNVAPWVDKDSQITIRVGRAKRVNGNEGYNMPNRLEFYGTAVAIFGAIAIGVWTVSTRIDDKVSESRVELNTTMQNNKTEIMTALQNNQTIILSRIDKLEDRSRDDSKTLSKIELLLESKQDKK